MTITRGQDKWRKNGEQGTASLAVTTLPGAERVVPASAEAEEAVLGSLLLDREAIVRVAPLVGPEDFFSEERGHIYRAILALYHAETPADLIEVRDRLKTTNLLGEADGQVRPAYLLRLMAGTASPVHLDHYVNLMRKYSLFRRIIRYGTEATVAGFDQQTEPTLALAGLSDQLQELINWTRRGQEQSYFLRHEATLDYLDRFDQPQTPTDATGQSGKVRLRFGLECLDGRPPEDVWDADGIAPTMLLLRSTLTAVVADTSVGKTILAEQIAEANARAGASVLFFHNELSHEQMIWRRNNRLSGVPVWKQVEAHRLGSHDLQLLAKAAGQVHTWPGRIDYVFCPDWTAREIAEETRLRHLSLTAATGQGYDLVVADYLQNMGVAEAGWGETRAEKVAQNVHWLHNLANQLDVAVLFTSQLGRDGKREEGFVKPTLHGGLESGSIERHSNQVLGLWRESAASATDALLICLKSTFGQRGWSKPLQFVENRLEFMD